MGLILVPFLGQVLVPKLVQIRFHFWVGFWAPFWPQKVARISYKAPQKASNRHRSAPRRARSGCASAVLALYEKAAKTLYFTMVLAPPSCPKRPQKSQKALMRPSCTPRSGQEDSTKATRTASSETSPKKTQKIKKTKTSETSPKYVRIEVRKRVRKWRARACANQRPRSQPRNPSEP